jgi:hypothetical protein
MVAQIRGEICELPRVSETANRLKIRAKMLHENAVTRNVLNRSVLAFSPPASGCTKMQQDEADPALDPAPDFAAQNAAMDGSENRQDCLKSQKASVES